MNNISFNTKIISTIKKNIFLEIKKNNDILIFYDYNEELLPKKGWFHYCFFCNLVTCNENFYCVYKNRNIFINKCSKCNLNEDNKKKTNKVMNIILPLIIR